MKWVWQGEGEDSDGEDLEVTEEDRINDALLAADAEPAPSDDEDDSDASDAVVDVEDLGKAMRAGGESKLVRGACVLLSSCWLLLSCAGCVLAVCWLCGLGRTHLMYRSRQSVRSTRNGTL